MRSDSDLANGTCPESTRVAIISRLESLLENADINLRASPATVLFSALERAAELEPEPEPILKAVEDWLDRLRGRRPAPTPGSPASAFVPPEEPIRVRLDRQQAERARGGGHVSRPFFDDVGRPGFRVTIGEELVSRATAAAAYHRISIEEFARLSLERMTTRTERIAESRRSRQRRMRGPKSAVQSGAEADR